MEHVLDLLDFNHLDVSGHGALVFGLIWFVNLYTLGRLFQSEIDLYVVKKNCLVKFLSAATKYVMANAVLYFTGFDGSV